MKTIKLFFALFLALVVTSCVSTVALDQKFYNNKKVGVILKVDTISVARAGAQGLLDMALTEGKRFKEPLKKIEPEFSLEKDIKNEISNILSSKNKSFEFINAKIDYKTLPKFKQSNDSDIKYSAKDFRKFKNDYNVDELMVIDVRYGLLVSYYGFIETDKFGYNEINIETINLGDNSLLQQEKILSMKSIKGNWKKDDNMKNAIKSANDESMEALKTKF